MVYQFSSWICLIAAQTLCCQEAGNGKRIFISNGNSTKMVWFSSFKFVLIHYSLWWMQLVVETVSWSQHKNLIFPDRYKATDFYISLWLQQLHSWLAEEALKAWGPWGKKQKVWNKWKSNTELHWWSTLLLSARNYFLFFKY